MEACALEGLAFDADGTLLGTRGAQFQEVVVVDLASGATRKRASLGVDGHRLDVQLAAMEQARARSDFVELASLAHFLKGVAGSVGFDDFTEPSRALEGAARAGVESEVDASLAALRGLTARVVLPEEQPDPKAASA